MKIGSAICEIAPCAVAIALLGGCREVPLPSAASPTGLPSLTDAACVARADFGPPASSSYCLPIPEGTDTVVSQAYCSEAGWSHRGRFAYDFDCEAGDWLVAARAGYVEMVGEAWPDDDQSPGHENRVVIRHEDGTAAFYAHFQEQGVEVRPGDTVSVGQRLGRCGSSGTSLPHLHFEVFESVVYDWDHGLPVSFRNVSGALDARGGLAGGSRYAAQSCR